VIARLAALAFCAGIWAGLIVFGGWQIVAAVLATVVALGVTLAAVEAFRARRGQAPAEPSPERLAVVHSLAHRDTVAIPRVRDEKPVSGEIVPR
jgi:hypothetical protein